MYFCENCNELTEATACPKCGKPTREPQSNDLCFVTEFGGMGNSMFSDALSNNDIEFVAAPVHGGFSRFNTPKGYKIYVRYADYGNASQILSDIFGGQDDTQTECIDDPASAIDRLVKVVVDRPLGSVHPEHPDIVYELNYGHVEGVMGGDGEEQDAYIIRGIKGLDAPLPRSYEFEGCVIAVIVRKNDVETKWVVAPMLGISSPKFTKEQVAKAVRFQEKYFDIEIIM